LGHSCFKFLQFGFGWLLGPPRRLEGFQLLGQIGSPASAHGRNTLGFEFAVKVRDVHHLGQGWWDRNEFLAVLVPMLTLESEMDIDGPQPAQWFY